MSTDNFFGGAAGLSWPKANQGTYSDTRLRGVARGGLIVDDPTVQPMTEMGTGKPLTWSDGRPKQQMVVTLLCDGRGGKAMDERDPANPSDNGRRRLYIRGYMVAAIREALQKAGAEGLRQGGELLVAWVDEKPSKTAGFDPARVWAAQYSPPAVGLPDGGAQSQPQSGLSGAPAGNPFGGGAPVTGPPVQQPSGPPANPFGGGAQAQQQAAPVGAPPANPFG